MIEPIVVVAFSWLFTLYFWEGAFRRRLEGRDPTLHVVLAIGCPLAAVVRAAMYKAEDNYSLAWTALALLLSLSLCIRMMYLSYGDAKRREELNDVIDIRSRRRTESAK